MMSVSLPGLSGGERRLAALFNGTGRRVRPGGVPGVVVEVQRPAARGGFLAVGRNNTPPRNGIPRVALDHVPVRCAQNQGRRKLIREELGPAVMVAMAVA